MTVHLQGDHPSIAYYGLDNTYLGDYHFPVTSETFVCASGYDSGGTLRSACCDANDNDVFCVGTTPCVITGGPPSVTDGCYGGNLAVSPTSSLSVSSVMTSLSATDGTTPNPTAPSDSTMASSGSSSTPNFTHATQTSMVSPSSNPSDPSTLAHPKSSVSAGTLAGAVVGTFAVMSLFVALTFWLCTTRDSRYKAGVRLKKRIRAVACL
ncbi:hypothetical protein SISNIDRAFT_482037 [Sistotremastrum niveocremeum HHB9708]|uniref:Uncharacterized protein n=1 Tax=Sistotremastrum niveocremeum HHB9708 TaxID=1314777 RepID=A0A164YP26_9AGAM|nr:hypothetical protein SISNIDRAFT_482037 [Sistotremastrum niveocremeum HHB9708]